MSMIGTIAMIVAGIGAVVGIRQSKAGAAWGRPVAAICALLTLGLAIMGMISAGGGSSAKGMMAAMNKYNFICGETMGSHLAEKFSGSRALVLVQPIYQEGLTNTDLQDALVEGLVKGMGTSLELTQTVALTPPASFLEQMGGQGGEDEESMDMMAYEMMNYEMWFDAKHFADILAEHEGTYDVLISTVGLPIDFGESSMANQSGLPEIAVLNAPMYGMQDLVKGGTLDAVIVYKPTTDGWKDAQNVPADTAEAFDKRFVLVTADNVDEVSATYPNMFN